MHSSTSRSDHAAAPFFARGLACLTIASLVALGAGAAAGLLYRGQALAPAAAEIAATDHFVVLFGSSRFEAGIDPERLASRLWPGSRVGVRAFTGGNWDTLHDYQLARLSSDVLRPGRDAVLIEISPFSTNDANPGNQLYAIRPRPALTLAALPGTPVEARLDLLMGAAVAAYRYRISIQSLWLAPRLDSAAKRIVGALGAVGSPVAEKPFQLVTVPGRETVIQEIRGDVAVFTAMNRSRLETRVRALRIGGFKVEALRRAVETLRARDIAVFLVEVPSSRWLRPLLHESDSGRRFDEAVRAIAAASGAHLLQTWPEELSDERLYWDDEHMAAATGARFTDSLAKAVVTAGAVPLPLR